MHITGKNFIGSNRSTQTNTPFRAFSLLKDEYLEGEFSLASTQELESALTLAEKAFLEFKEIPVERRAIFLDAIAEEIIALGDELLERCSLESGLPLARLTGERGRTCGQLRMFAQLIRDGWYVDARIDKAQPDRQPLPKSDIRRMLVPIGPVAVFGASNFPLAFSTAGGDTASALAAGCPVIVKSHPSHPGTNELISGAIVNAAQKTGMPEGVFSSLHLSNNDAIKLVSHPVIKAVGFTGSRNAGMHLFNAAAARPQPIPVYAEMSAINPVLLMPGALAVQNEKIAKDLASSVVLGAGQFCTNPGLVLAINSADTQSFLLEFAKHIAEVKPTVMLNKNICQAYKEGISVLQDSLASQLAASTLEPGEHQTSAAAFTISAQDFISDRKYMEEVFGPSTMIVLCDDETQFIQVLNSLEGQLTATIHATAADAPFVKQILPVVSEKAGRVIYGGYPTGVEVCHSMQHGGPFPATTDGRSTSVGTAAIYRFLRPLAFQDFPEELLPDALKDHNPLNIVRLVDGEWMLKG